MLGQVRQQGADLGLGLGLGEAHGGCLRAAAGEPVEAGEQVHAHRYGQGLVRCPVRAAVAEGQDAAALEGDGTQARGVAGPDLEGRAALGRGLDLGLRLRGKVHREIDHRLAERLGDLGQEHALAAAGGAEQQQPARRRLARQVQDALDLGGTRQGVLGQLAGEGQVIELEAGRQRRGGLGGDRQVQVVARADEGDDLLDSVRGRTRAGRRVCRCGLVGVRVAVGEVAIVLLVDALDARAVAVGRLVPMHAVGQARQRVAGLGGAPLMAITERHQVQATLARGVPMEQQQ